MIQFTYKIKDPAGIHARPAGILVKLANGFKSTITVSKAGKSGDLKRIFSIMALGAKQGEQLDIHIEGEDENQAKEAILKCLQDNF